MEEEIIKHKAQPSSNFDFDMEDPIISKNNIKTNEVDARNYTQWTKVANQYYPTTQTIKSIDSGIYSMCKNCI